MKLNKSDQKELEQFRKNREKREQEEKEAREKAQKEGKRLYKSQESFVDHDLFKLKVAPMLHNKGVEGMAPNHVKVEHCHFFHSFDSKGQKQTHSTSTAGHCHPISFMPDENGELIAKCGASVIRHKGKFLGLADSKSVHTHDVEYIVSEKIQVKTSNKEAQKVGLK